MRLASTPHCRVRLGPRACASARLQISQAAAAPQPHSRMSKRGPSGSVQRWCRSGATLPRARAAPAAAAPHTFLFPPHAAAGRTPGARLVACTAWAAPGTRHPRPSRQCGPRPKARVPPPRRPWHCSGRHATGGCRCASPTQGPRRCTWWPRWTRWTRRAAAARTPVGCCSTACTQAHAASRACARWRMVKCARTLDPSPTIRPAIACACARACARRLGGRHPCGAGAARDSVHWRRRRLRAHGAPPRLRASSLGPRAGQRRVQPAQRAQGPQPRAVHRGADGACCVLCVLRAVSHGRARASVCSLLQPPAGALW